MKNNNNKLIVALIIASTATTLLPTSNSYTTEKIEQTETNLVESKEQVDTNIDKSLEKNQIKKILKMIMTLNFQQNLPKIMNLTMK